MMKRSILLSLLQIPQLYALPRVRPRNEPSESTSAGTDDPTLTSASGPLFLPALTVPYAIVSELSTATGQPAIPFIQGVPFEHSVFATSSHQPLASEISQFIEQASVEPAVLSAGEHVTPVKTCDGINKPTSVISEGILQRSTKDLESKVEAEPAYDSDEQAAEVSSTGLAPMASSSKPTQTQLVSTGAGDSLLIGSSGDKNRSRSQSMTSHIGTTSPCVLPLTSTQVSVQSSVMENLVSSAVIANLPTTSLMTPSNLSLVPSLTSQISAGHMHLRFGSLPTWTLSPESSSATPRPTPGVVNLAVQETWVTAVLDGKTVSWINTYDGQNSNAIVHATIDGQPVSWSNVYGGITSTGPHWITATINGKQVSWLDRSFPTSSWSNSPSSSISQVGPSSITPMPQITIVKGATETVVITTELDTTLTVSEVQTVTVTNSPTRGVVNTSLNMTGQNTVVPFNTTSLPPMSSSITPITQGSLVITSTQSVAPNRAMSSNIFVPLATVAPPPQISSRANHPVPRLGIVMQDPPLQTNKFYANFFLGSRTQGTWTHPYSVAWVKGTGASGSYGISVSQVDRDRVVYGDGSPARYFINPIGLQSLILSAKELGSSTELTTDTLRAFSINVNLSQRPGVVPTITFPLVQGMGFVTGVYNQGTPLIQSTIYFRGLMYWGIVPGTLIAKYSASLNDGTTWLIYLRPSSGSSVPTLSLLNSGTIVANKPFSGSVQVAKVPTGIDAGPIYDQHAGVYPLRGGVTATVNSNVGSYTFSWTKGGNVNRRLLMFALPHHIQSLQLNSASAQATQLKLETTTKGMATAISGDSWTLTENNLPYDMGFAPWSPTLRSQTNLPQSAMNLIKSVASQELAEDINAQTNLDSMYFSGKGLAKFATIVFTANNLARDSGTASAGLMKLKNAFARFVNNTQTYPLVYDTSWGGMVSSAAYVTGDANADFGNTYYNDHHFHYGYFVYTAAVIGFLDPSWLTQGSNVAWVNALVRDYANSIPNDPYFPFSRMFDWYHGHSWAHGLYESGDGKDQESSSEDAFSSYALKMWGRTINDPNLEARGNLMLSITARSLDNYYLMQSNNLVQPPRFIGNKAAGILFENKVDHTTYFGTNIEYIEGIHMLPLNPSSTLTRQVAFVQQEWNTYFSNGRVDSIQGGWKGILYANLAIIDAKTAYNFFASPNFQAAWLDGGASRSWYLALAAGLGGAQ